MLQGRNLYVKSYCFGRFILPPRESPTAGEWAGFVEKPILLRINTLENLI